jgi:trans-aconitate 2-methyltransferase
VERICEPELMDEPAQARAYAEADFAASDQALVERFTELFASGSAVGQRIVDLGCGPGNITFLLAARFPEAHVLGLDGAAAMLAIAEERRPRAARLRFQQAVLPLGDDQALRLRSEAAGGKGEAVGFSAVLSNSLLHHLHDPAVLWTTVRQLAGPGAALYVQDLRRPVTAAAAEALVATAMATAPEVLRRDYRHSLHAAFTPEEVTVQLEQAGLGGLRVQERGERYLEVWGRLPLTATSAA